MYQNNTILDDFKGAFRKSNNAHVQLIIINVAVFIVLGLLKVMGDIGGFTEAIYLLDKQFVIPPSFSELATRPWTLVTYMFNHGGIFHILFNMLWFYYFGKLIIEYLGNDRLISTYILGGLAGAGAYLLMYNFVPYYVARAGGVGMVGASAAINAIIVASATLLPNYTFHLLFFGAVRIKYIAMFVVLLSVLSMTGGNAGGNIAHLGGAAIGYLFVNQINRGYDIGKWVTILLDFFKSFFVSQPKMRVNRNHKKANSYRKAKRNSSSEQVSQQDIDAILDKISQSGYESLSKEEKQQLFNASKK